MTREQERGLVILLCVGLLVGGAVLVRPTGRGELPRRVAPILISDVTVIAPVLIEPAKVNVNTADAAALTELPGVGPALAARIVAYRQEHGPFRSIDALVSVSGIGPATVDKLRTLATIDENATPVRREL